MNILLKSTGLIILSSLSSISFSQESDEGNDSRIASISVQTGIYASPTNQVDLAYIRSEYADMLTNAGQDENYFTWHDWEPSFSYSVNAELNPKKKNRNWTIGFMYAQQGHDFYLPDQEITRIDTLDSPNSTSVAYIDSIYNHSSRLDYKNTDLKVLIGGKMTTNPERRFSGYLGCQFGLGLSVSSLTFDNRQDEYEWITYNDGYYFSPRLCYVSPSLWGFNESVRTDYGFTASVTGVIGGNLRIRKQGLLEHANLFLEYRPRVSFNSYKNREDILYASTSDMNIGIKVTL